MALHARCVNRDGSPLQKMQEEGYFQCAANFCIADRYVVVKEVGRGTFATVFICTDKAKNSSVALKILRAIPKYYEAGKQEVKHLHACWQAHASNVVEILDHFDFQGHLVIVFPAYGASLLDLLKANEFRGYNQDWSRELSRNFLSGVLSLHMLGKIHTDIKPENIMSRGRPVSTPVRGHFFVHPPNADLVLIDLGSTVDLGSKKPKLVCTRQYRAPEIMLGLEFDQKLDVWSCACVLFEMLTGRTLFRTHDSACHLCQIQRLMGPCPPDLMQRTMQNGQCKLLEYFDFQTQLWVFPQCELPEQQAFQAMRPLSEELQDFDYNIQHMLASMLQWDPAARPTIDEVLKHPFFMQRSRDHKSVQTNLKAANVDNTDSLLRQAVRQLLAGQITKQDFILWCKQQ